MNDDAQPGLVRACIKLEQLELALHTQGLSDAAKAVYGIRLELSDAQRRERVQEDW